MCIRTDLASLRRVLPGMALAILAACGSSRGDLQPVPPDLTNEAVIPGFEEVRYVGDLSFDDTDRRILLDRADAIERRVATSLAEGEPLGLEFLALSGGGQYGAFSAGILTQWTKQGTRPEFDIVSGISTGSIIAPFAFLGPDYDDELTEIYTTLSTEDVVKPAVGSAIFGASALGNTEPLKAQIQNFITRDFLDLIAAEHAEGRRLLIGTTNLDAGRPVVWDMGAIASSRHSQAPELFQSIILASSAIPVAFPPVFFEVEARGQRYYEMHVDGGVTTQVSALSPQLPITEDVDRVAPNAPRQLYVIVNGEAAPPGQEVAPSALSIGGASVTTLWYSQTRGDLYRIYTTALRDKVDVRFAWMGADFVEVPDEEFDPVFMGKLFDYGQAQVRNGTVWKSTPPGFVAR